MTNAPTPRLPQGKPARAGNSQAATAARRQVFVQAYMANGHNATQAAITAGFSPNTAYSAGQRLLKSVEVSGELAAAAEAVAARAGLMAKSVILELVRLAFSDVRLLYRHDGTLKNVHEIDEDTRAAIASIETEEIKRDGAVVGRTTKVKFWDKNAALEKAMRHCGLYERDNAQASKPVHITMTFE